MKIIWITSFLIYYSILLNVHVNAQDCSILFLYFYDSPLQHDHGFLITIERTKYELTNYFLNSENPCNFVGLSYDNINNTILESTVDNIYNDIIKNNSFNRVFLYLSTELYYDNLEYLSKKYEDFTIIVYGPRVFRHYPNVIAYYTSIFRELDVFSCYYMIKENGYENITDLRVGFVSSIYDKYTNETLDIEIKSLKKAAKYISEHDSKIDIKIDVVGLEGFKNLTEAQATTVLLLDKYRSKCISSIHNTVIPYKTSSEYEDYDVYSASRDIDSRLYMKNITTSNKVLLSIKFFHTENFFDIINLSFEDRLDELEGKYFSHDCYIDGFSPLLSYESRENLLKVKKIVSSNCESKPDDIDEDDFLYDFYDYLCTEEPFMVFKNDICLDEPVYNDSIYFCKLDMEQVMNKLYLKWKSSEVIVLSTLNSIFILLCIISSVDLIINWNHNEFKKASNIFCLLMIIGLVFIGISLFLWFGLPTKGSCISRLFLAGIGFSLIYSCILAKNYRVWRIFSGPSKFKVMTILDYQLLLKFCLPIVGMELLILILWFSIKTPYVVYNQYPIDDVLSLDYTYTCYFNTTFLSIFLVYKCVLLIPAALLSYSTRTVSKEYKETQIIAISVYNTFLIVFFVIIATLAVKSILLSYTFIVYGIFIIVIFTYIVTFIPKHYRVRFNSNSSKTGSSGKEIEL